MTPSPAPHCSSPAFLLPSRLAARAAEAGSLPNGTPPPVELALPQPLPRRAIEAALDAGSRRLYGPMAETRLVERRGQP